MVWGSLGKAAAAQVREIVREELRSEIERILNPTFIQLMRDGREDMQKIFDAVIACDEKHERLALAVKLLEESVAALQAERRLSGVGTGSQT